MTRTGNLALWNSGVGIGNGLKFFRGWLHPTEAEYVFGACNDDRTFPWNPKPRLYGFRIPQHSYVYQRSSGNRKHPGAGLDALEDLCLRIESDFDCKVDSVYCNRFRDPAHRIEWHQDRFATHIMVLSLGGTRGLEFRHNRTQEITRYVPKAGDLYFMSLQHNRHYHHRVLSGDETAACCSEATTGGGDPSSSTRISFVFFVTAPFRKKEYRVGFGESLLGVLNSLAF